MSRRILFPFLALLCCAATPLQAQTTTLFFDSQPGDYIGGGLRRTWTASDLTFSVISAAPSQIRLHATSSSIWWYLTFRAPEGGTLTPGLYERAARAPFRPAPVPGLDVSGDGRGCNVLSGRFLIHEIVFSGSTLTRFAADFEQHCDVRPTVPSTVRSDSIRHGRRCGHRLAVA